MITIRLSVLRNLSCAILLLSCIALGQNNGLVWSTLFGGSAGEYPWARHGLIVAGNGDIVCWGRTRSTNLPTQGAYQKAYVGTGTKNWGDGWLARFSSDGRRLIWSTYLGGTGDDMIYDCALSSDGTITVCGTTNSPKFPTTAGAFQTAPQGMIDAFVTRLVWNGTSLQLVWSTYLGAVNEDSARRLAVHPNGSVVVAGFTASAKFPMAASSYQGTYGGGPRDAFVSVLDATGQNLQAATFLGGLGMEYIEDMILDHAGNLIVVGLTSSTSFPTTSYALQRSHRGGSYDGFVSRLDLGLRRLTYSTYIGGNGIDAVTGLALGKDGSITIGGQTASNNLPTTPYAFDSTANGGTDSFAARIDTRRTGAAQLAWCTYLGGALGDPVNSIAIDPCGMVTLVGSTSSSNFRTTPGAHSATLSGLADGFVTQLDPSQRGAAQLVYSTYLGGSNGRNWDYAYGVALDRQGNAVVAGLTSCINFPTTPGAFQTTLSGPWDVFITKMSLLPLGATRYGYSTPACLSSIYQSVNSSPARGNARFAVSASGASPLAAGLFILSSPAKQSWPFTNVTFFLSPASLLTLAQFTNTKGCATQALPIPANTKKGTTIATQWLFLTSPTCPGTGLFSTSEALRVVIQ